MLLSSVARPLLAAVAVANGMETLRDPKPKLEAAEGLLARVPMKVDPALIVQADAALKIVGGLLMGLGWAPKLAAIALAADLIPTTVAEHPFSATASPETRRARQANFLSNCGLLGGLLLAVATPDSKPKTKRP
ncbi:MAG TPA: DoxX family membrane protein [Pseudonocardiaceae bacterium]|nr:DoxX family membrane protein [Pseudonocardiaceae bacterium]